jgi:hypothetical protein
MLKFRSLNNNLLALIFLGMGMFSSASQAGLIFSSDSATGSSSRAANSGILTRFEVDSDFTLTQIAVELDLSGNGNLNFVIFDSLSGSLLFQSGATAFIDDGMAFKFSDLFSFTLTSGVRYAMGALADVANIQNFVIPGGKTMGDVRSLGENQNASNFLSPTMSLRLNGVDGRIQLYGESGVAQVPTPATLALFGIGLAALAWTRRKCI